MDIYHRKLGYHQHTERLNCPEQNPKFLDRKPLKLMCINDCFTSASSVIYSKGTQEYEHLNSQLRINAKPSYGRMTKWFS